MTETTEKPVKLMPTKIVDKMMKFWAAMTTEVSLLGAGQAEAKALSSAILEELEEAERRGFNDGAGQQLAADRSKASHVGNMGADAIESLQKKLNEADAKWRRYEKDYILPPFEWAKEVDFDLQAAVRDNAGKNCVRLLHEHMLDLLAAARARITEIEQIALSRDVLLEVVGEEKAALKKELDETKNDCNLIQQEMLRKQEMWEAVTKELDEVKKVLDEHKNLAVRRE